MTTLLALRPAPARRPGALAAPHHDLRPCVTNPAQWWDTGNPHNQQALDHCRSCPFAADCAPADSRDAAGTIRAGTAYDDHGRPAELCRTCNAPLLARAGAPVCVNGHGSVASHHDTIAALRQQGLSFAQIGARLGISDSAINRYWTQHLNRTGQRHMRVDRLPGVPDGCSTNRVQDYHDQVVAMLTDLNAAYTYQEVAYAIGATTDAVKGYWRRHQAQARDAGLPVMSRRSVSNRGGRHQKKRQVQA